MQKTQDPGWVQSILKGVVLGATLLAVTADRGALRQEGSLTELEERMMHRPPLDLDVIRDRKPSWAGLSDAEKEANVAAAWWPQELSRRRRRLQATAGVNESDILRYWKGQQTAAACDDKLAENFGVQSACTYSCPSLRQHFFPRKPSKSVRCFIYDQSAGRWPPQLLSMIQQRRDEYIYISPTPISSQSAPLKFSVGKGKVCRNVTFTTSDLMGHQSISTRIDCLVDGEHQHTHVVNNKHTVNITHDSGSASSGVHSGSGGKTNFTIGTCSNILVRINTTQAGTKAAAWVVNDGGHNGPWTFTSPSTAGIFERALCLYDNDFTVEHRLSSDWHGSVSVVRFIDFRSTILVPSDQNWIIQGSSQKVLPVRLDARFQTGTPTDPSEASLIVRRVRFTGRSAPVDIEPAHLSWTFRGFDKTTVRCGGVLLYEGGGRNPADLPTILFEQTVFDHNDADSDTILRLVSGEDAVRGISITFDGCLTFRNFAKYQTASAGFTMNMWPFRMLMRNVDHIDNDAGWGLPNAWPVIFSRDPGSIESPAPARLVESESTYLQENVKYSTIAGSALQVAYWGILGGTGMETVFTAPGLNRRMKITYAYKNIEVTGLRAWMPLLFYAWKTNDAVDLHYFMDNVRVNGVKDAPWKTKTQTTEAHVVSKLISAGKGSYFTVRKTQISDCSTAKASMWRVGGPWLGEFENTAFRNNKASNGAAMLLQDTQQVTLRQCSFIGNMATESAGAVLVRGAAGGSKMFVQNCVFHNNKVQASSRSNTHDFGLLLQNSRYARNNQDVAGYRKRYVIWQIDDGPINGVDWATCEVARNHSVEGVKRGLKPSWPDRASACGNTSFLDQDQLYVETVTLSMGHHVLRTGVIAMGSWLMSFNNWGSGAYIKIDGLIDRLQPKILDDRMTRYKGCTNTGDLNHPYPCPPGDAIWAPDFGFTVAVNRGGAIVAEGDVDMRITDSVFSKNRAPKGHSLSAQQAQLKITNTTIDAKDQAMLLTVGAAVATCQENKCEKGYWCDFRNHSVFCDRCGKANEWGDGLVCRGCPPGQGPKVDRGGCEDCARGWFSTLGQCNRCPPGTASSKDRQTCLKCPPRQTARANDCTCEQGFFNVTITKDGRKIGPSCHRTGFAQNVLSSTALDCETCASGDLAECIAECDGQEIFVQPGWSALEHKDGALAIFKCRFGSSGPDVVNGSGSCPGGWVGGQHSTILPCNVGYRGTLCGVCAENWALRSDGECVNCDEDALYQNIVVFISLFVIFAIFVWLTQSSRRTGFMQLDAIRNAVKAVQELNLSQIVRIIVATLQICSNLSAVLHVKLPAIFDDFLRWLAGLVNVDLAQYFNCMTSGSYVSSLIVTVLLVPIVMLLVGAIYVYQRYQMDKEEHGEMSDVHVEQLRTLFKKFDTDGTGIELDEVRAIVQEVDPKHSDEEIIALFKKADNDGSGIIDFDEFHAAVLESHTDDDSKTLDLQELVKKKQKVDLTADAFNRLLLFVFLLYPGLTSKIFQAFWCRTLTDSSVLIADYSFECIVGGEWTSEWSLLVTACSLLVLAWPIGLPAFLYYIMNKEKDLILADDEDTLQKYSFVCGDYKREYWYWEVVEYGRKLLLSGLIGMVSILGVSTIWQSVAAAFVSFFFFAISVNHQPFALWQLNLFKSWSEFQLFGLLLVVVVLQANRNDIVDVDSFGVFQLVLTLTILPIGIAILYSLYTSRAKLRSQTKEDSHQTMTSNPVREEEQDVDEALTMLETFRETLKQTFSADLLELLRKRGALSLSVNDRGR